jgi:hypothetical protein
MLCSAISISHRGQTRRCVTASCGSATPQQPWMAAVWIPTALAARAHHWLATYVAAATQGTALVTSSAASRWRSSPHTRPRERDEEV